ncbi:MAG: T9SS type A sorting domain-containing protein, partial [Bacteroidales bacterium]
ENTEHHRNIELRCFNLLGMQQHQTTILRGQQQASANVSAWPPGMYVVVVYSEGRPVGRGKFVVQR